MWYYEVQGCKKQREGTNMDQSKAQMKFKQERKLLVPKLSDQVCG